MIKPDNKTFTVFFNVENNNINIPISNFDKDKNEVTINSSSKKLKLILNKNNSDMKNKGSIKINNTNSVEGKFFPNLNNYLLLKSKISLNSLKNFFYIWIKINFIQIFF